MNTRKIIELNHDFIARMTADDWERIKKICLYKDPRYGYHVKGVRILGTASRFWGFKKYRQKNRKAINHAGFETG